MNIKVKLLNMALLPLLVIVIAMVSQYGVRQKIMVLQSKGESGDSLSRTTATLITLSYEYGITHGERAAVQWGNQYDEITRLLSEMARWYVTSEEKAMADDLRLKYHAAAKWFANLRAYDNREKPGVPAAPYQTLRTNMVNRLVLDLQAIVPITDRIHSESIMEIQRFLHYASVIFIVVMLILALAILVLSLWISKGINQSLSQLQKGIEAVAAGDLEHRVGLATPDEIGFLARGFDAMTERLSAMTVSRDALAKEIEERRLVEEERNLSETKYRLLFENMSAGFALHEMIYDSEGRPVDYRFLEINPAFEKLTGVTAVHLLGKTVKEVMPNTEQYWIDVYAKTARSGESIAYQNYSQELGRYYDVWAFSPAKDRFAVIFTDITERKQAEEELKQLYNELEQRVVARTHELEQKTLEVEETQRALINIVEDLNHKTLELEEANLKLQDIDRLKSMFIASMSHELRTPLNSIIGFTSILQGEWLGPLNAEQKEKLAIVLRTGKHLLSLINDLIDISKIEAGKLESIIDDFDLYDLITEAVGLSAGELAARGVELQVEAIHQPMQTDRRRLYQCVVNLVGNAVKFTPKGKITVKVSLIREPDEPGGRELVVVTVADTGIGIREEDLTKLFTSFIRLALPDGMMVKGTGLGLYLVKKIVTDILAGTVGVTSVHGQGSEFRLTVPVSVSHNGDAHETSPGSGR